MDEARIRLKLSGPDLDRDEIVVGRQGMRAGRSADNTLQLSHREISRQHFRIVWSDDKYWVEDLNSANGVWLNDERMTPRIPTELREDDVIRAGPFLLRFIDYVFPEPVFLERPREADGALPALNGYRRSMNYPPGIPIDKSTWLQYLPEIYSEDEFLGRYLLIFESILSPIIWIIDNFDFYLSPEVAPVEWLQWIAGWFDLLLLPELAEEQQREIIRQLGWLFLRRGTHAGLERLLELYFGVTPEIIEDEYCHFVVILALSESKSGLSREVADRLINSQKPAFASYTLETA